MEVRGEYKKTGSVLIPADWEEHRIGDIAFCRSGGTPDTNVPEYYNGIISWITSSELNKGRINETEGFISQKGLENSSARLVHKDTFLIAMYGATAGVGAISNITGAINQAVLAITSSIASSEYLYQYFKLHKENIVSTFTQGGQPNLSGNIIKAIKIPIPSTLEEQTAIATVLSDTDALISGLEKLIAKKRNIKLGAMQELLKPKKGWEVKKLGEIVDFWDGRRKPIKDTERSKMKGIYPYYGASGVIDYVNDYLFDDEIILLGEDGENIISRNQKLAFKVSGKVWVNNHAHVLKPKNEIDIGFLTEKLESLNYESYNSGTAQPKLNQKTCSLIPIDLPRSKNEQKQISGILSDMDSEITALESKVSKYRQIKTGMMQNLLTGKIRLV